MEVRDKILIYGLRNDCNLLVTEKKRLHQGYCSIHYLEKNILKLYYPYKDFFYKYIIETLFDWFYRIIPQ
jgi:hypothetical protein